MAQFDNCLAEGGTDMRQVKFLVRGWNVQPNGSYHRFKALCVFEQAEICLPLATMRDDDTTVVKVNDIEVVWNAD